MSSPTFDDAPEPTRRVTSPHLPPHAALVLVRRIHVDFGLATTTRCCRG